MRIGIHISAFLMPLMALMLLSCGGDPPVIDTSTSNQPDIKRNALNANRYLIEREQTSLNSYAQRHQWQVQHLDCGALLHVEQNGKGAMIGNDDTVTLRYHLEDLAGTVIYNDSTQTYIAGRLEPCEGLDAAVMLLHRGAKAHVLLPSGVAFGVVGDGNAIPPRTPLAYTIQVL